MALLIFAKEREGSGTLKKRQRLTHCDHVTEGNTQGCYLGVS